jgi:aspartate racemase
VTAVDNGAPLIGVLGGMGPIASAAFVETVYELDPPLCEQAAPRLVLWSDPAIVDRSAAIAARELDALRDAVETAVHGLLACGAERVVMACVTAHVVLDQLPADIRGRIVSIIDPVFDEVERLREPHLLVTTTGTRAAGVFERHDRWPASREFLPLPDEGEQERLHELLYRLKRNEGIDDVLEFLRNAVSRAGAAGFVAGCTELHLVTRAMARADVEGDIRAVDPLMTMAARMRAGAV